MNPVFYDWGEGYSVYFMGRNIAHVCMGRTGWFLVTNNQCRYFRRLETLEHTVQRNCRRYMETKNAA